MVYPRNWILEDELSTGRTLGVFGLSLVFQHLAFATEKILNLEVTTLCMSRTRWVWDDALSSTLCSGRDVGGWDVMSKGGMEIWHPVRPPFELRVKRHVIHHGCIVCAQKIRGRLLQELMTRWYCKRLWKIGREHSTYCGRNLVCDQPGSQYSIGLRTCHFWHQDDVIDQCWPVIVVYWSVLHLILDSTWVWYSLLLELKIPTLVWHWDYVLCPRHFWTLNIVGFILSKWWEHS